MSTALNERRFTVAFSAAPLTSLLLLLPPAVVGAEEPLPQSGFRSGDPAEQLPSHIQRLTWIGERPDWRHDGERFVFVSNVFDQVYEYERSTGRLFSLSDHFLHHGFTRAQYLANGDTRPWRRSLLEGKSRVLT